MFPGEVIFEEYTLEYGKDRLEMHVGAVERGEQALVVDDLIATGGTLCAAMNLLGSYHANIQKEFPHSRLHTWILDIVLCSLYYKCFFA